jgi:hypothetical protein
MLLRCLRSLQQQSAIYIPVSCLWKFYSIEGPPRPGWLLVAGMIALRASAALLSHFPFSDYHEPRVVTGPLLLLAGCCYVANALTAKRGVSTLRSDHLRHRTFALLEEKDGSIDRKIKISSFQSPINFARIAYRTNSAVDEIPSLRIADAR